MHLRRDTWPRAGRQASQIFNQVIMESRMRTINIPLELLTAEAFTTFGTVIERGRDSVDFEKNPNRMINLGYEVDGRAELHLVRYLRQDMDVSCFERHLSVTEARVSLGESVVVLVAEQTALDDPSSISEPKSVRAFLVKAGQGFIFKRGVWHSLDCYPTAAKYADFAFFTEGETEEELVQFDDDLEQCRRSDILDVTRHHDVAFRVVDPMNLMTTETP